MRTIITVIFALLSFGAHAGGDKNKCYKCTFNNYYEENYYHEENFYDYSTTGISSSDLDAAMAASMAAGAVECSTSSRKHQAGVATGYASGKNAFAAGYCHSIGQSPDYAQTLGVKAAFATDMSPVYSLGYNIAW